MNFTIDLDQENDGRSIAEVIELRAHWSTDRPDKRQSLKARLLPCEFLPTNWNTGKQNLILYMSPSTRHESLVLDESQTCSNLAALLRIGWKIKRQSGSHRTLERAGWPDMVFAFHDEIGPRMLARISKLSGLKPEDL